jgi:hypothetical protein
MVEKVDPMEDKIEIVVEIRKYNGDNCVNRKIAPL